MAAHSPIGPGPVKRLRLWYAIVVIIVAIFGVRLFYLQIIRYGHYKAAALSDQLKQYEIPAERGTIAAHDGDKDIPLVLNQKLYTIFVDPVDLKTYKTNTDKLAIAAASVLGGDATTYQKDMSVSGTRYSVLAKKVSQSQRDKLMSMKFAGLYSEAQDYRTYPEGNLAAQVLGFVSDDGTGKYGIEQALNSQLKGTAGQLKAITDLSGVPLAASKNNVDIAPVNGKNVTLTLDMGMQAQMEKILQDQSQKTKSQGLSAVILDTHTGQVKAMANYPTYDPSNYATVSDPNVFSNSAITNAIEPGSIMKVLTTAAALDQGVITKDTTFYDPAHWIVDGFNIKDVEEDGGPRQQSIASLLNLSLNTGATWELMQMGGGQINTKARNAWHDYMVNHFQLSKPTGIEQGYESTGSIPGPTDNGAGIDLTYANTTFGQGMLATPLQMAAAYASVLNGGTYYRPYLVDSVTDSSGHTQTIQPKAIDKNVVSPKVSQDLISLLNYAVQQHYLEGYNYMKFPDNYSVGGKTGTAQIANPSGGYYDDKFNGTYAGFVGGNTAQYVIVIFNMQPSGAGYAGTFGGQPIFADLAHMLINGGYVTPKS